MVSGIKIVTSDKPDDFGYGLIVFGAIWLFILVLTWFKMFTRKDKGNKEVPLTAEYPKVEYPKAEYPDVTPTPADNTTQFDPQFFGSSKSDYEEDDEDYKRKKRQGYE